MKTIEDELREEIEKLSKEKKLLEIRLERESVAKITKQTIVDRKITGKKRRSSRLMEPSKTKILKSSAKDSITYSGLKGTLGTNLLRLGMEIVVKAKDEKSKYFAYLSKNSIIDLSNSSSNSQISLLGGKHIQNFLFAKYKNDDTKEIENVNIDSLENSFKKIKNSRVGKTVLADVEKFSPNNETERAIKNIYRYILEQQLFKRHLLTDEYLDECSEQSLVIKYWAYLFESFFSKSKDVSLQWGDTISNTCSRSNLRLKLDIRFIVELDKSKLDATIGEFAKRKATNKKKHYSDKLKAVLATKCHLNHLLSIINYLPLHKIKSVHIPIIQIMGLNCHIYSLSLVDKNVYVLQDIYSIAYPKTFNEIKTGALKKIIDGMSLIMNMIDNIKDIYDNFSRNANDEITKIVTENTARRKLLEKEEWVSLVIYTDDEEEEEEDEEEEEEEEEDDDEEEEEDEEEEKDGDEEGDGSNEDGDITVEQVNTA